MEQNKHTLSNALRALADLDPDENIWGLIQQKLQEDNLAASLQNLPVYSPQPQTWENIAAGLPVRRTTVMWWYAASVLIVFGLAAAWMYKSSFYQEVAFSQEQIDVRLQPEKQPGTDLAYQKLKAYCQTETLVCQRKDYKLLKDEYEKLDLASGRLHHAIGSYNTAPELVRQLNEVERQKTAVLNEMAKMI